MQLQMCVQEPGPIGRPFTDDDDERARLAALLAAARVEIVECWKRELDAFAAGDEAPSTLARAQRCRGEDLLAVLLDSLRTDGGGPLLRASYLLDKVRPGDYSVADLLTEVAVLARAVDTALERRLEGRERRRLRRWVSLWLQDTFRRTLGETTLP